MCKKIILTALFSITIISLQAQQIKVSYENKLNSLPELIQQYFKMEGIQHVRLTIQKSPKSKQAIFKKISYHNGTFTEKKVLDDCIHFILTDSLETLDFMAAPCGKDSLRISCFYPASNNMQIFTEIVKADDMKILMETYTLGEGTDTPLIAYSSGIPIEGGTYFCGVRNSGVEPRKWGEKFGLTDYFYYTITLEEEGSTQSNC